MVMGRRLAPPTVRTITCASSMLPLPDPCGPGAAGADSILVTTHGEVLAGQVVPSNRFGYSSIHSLSVVQGPPSRSRTRRSKPSSQHGAAGSVPQVTSAWVIHDGADGSHIRKEPAVAGVSHLTPVHLGLDVHKDIISVAILAPDRDGPDVERITHDEVSVRGLVGRLGDPRWLRACSEAGPTGDDLARLLHTMGVRCEVIAPSLLPKAPGERVKTDTCDCRPTAAGWPGCTGPGSWWRSASPASRRRRSATRAGPHRHRWKIAPGPGIACRSSCCARPALAGWERLDADPRALAAGPAVGQPSPGGDLCARPGGARRPRRSTRGDRGRLGRLA
jgi:hypothetical protein